MRLGVLDIGSNTVHLLVVDAHVGGHPLPAYSHKTELRLTESLKADGTIATRFADRLVSFITECLEIAQDQGVENVMGFATSAIRDAPNGEDVLRRVTRETGVELEVLSGVDEARVTFLAVRRWFGWSSGRLLVIDIGGGSLELAVGIDEEPDAAVSLPLGAGRLTRTMLPGDPPEPEDVKAVRQAARAQIGQQARPLLKAGEPHRVVGTSKTIRSLARLSGAAPSGEGPYVPRTLTREAVSDVVKRVAGLTAQQRADLPGVSHGRARQLLAGAIVIEGAMDLLRVERLEVCPWALREGLILRRLDQLVP